MLHSETVRGEGVEDDVVLCLFLSRAVFVLFWSQSQSGRNRGGEEVPFRDCKGKGEEEGMALCVFTVQFFVLL